MLKDSMGTAGFMAPEIHDSKEYSGYAVDAFAAGVSLFTFIAGRKPFLSATTNDPHYFMLITDPISFWQIHFRECGPIFSTEFRDLFMKMVSIDPLSRPSIDDIMIHPWTLGPIPKKTDV